MRPWGHRSLWGRGGFWIGVCKVPARCQPPNEHQTALSTSAGTCHAPPPAQALRKHKISFLAQGDPNFGGDAGTTTAPGAAFGGAMLQGVLPWGRGHERGPAYPKKPPLQIPPAPAV